MMRLKFVNTVLVLLLIAFIPQSVSQSPEGINWTQPAFDLFNSGHNPQQVITRDNVEDLELKWLYQSPERPSPIPGARMAFGTQAPPIVVYGLLYFVTESNRLTALNTLNGEQLWSFQYDPVELALSDDWSMLEAQHSISFFHDHLWMQTNDCNIFAFDPFNGEIKNEILDTCTDVPGNSGKYVGHYSPTFFETIIISRVSAGGGGGRSFVAGYDEFNGRMLWRWFSVPQSGGDPDWDFKDAEKGNIDPYQGDWGENDLMGGGSIFSLIAVDEENGIIYFPTSAPALAYDASLRPGPNLYTNSIVALDATTGKMIWYHQITPHDINGHEPTRSVILANANVNGEEKKVILAATKGDYAYVFDAATGDLLHDPISFGGQKINSYNSNQGNDANLEFSQDILESQEYCPGAFGGSSTTPAFADNTLFVASQTYCTRLLPSQVIYKDQVMIGYQIEATQTEQSSTVHAIDVSSGKIKWTFPIESRYQGGITVSGGVVYLVDIAGNFYALNSDTGEVLKKIPMNGAGNAAVTIAGDAKGNMGIFVATGGSKSGVIAAFGLPEDGGMADEEIAGLSRRGIIGSIGLTTVVGVLYLAFMRYSKKSK